MLCHVCVRCPTAKNYTHTPTIYNSVYQFLSRYCKRLLVDMYKFMSCKTQQHILSNAPKGNGIGAKGS